MLLPAPGSRWGLGRSAGPVTALPSISCCCLHGWECLVGAWCLIPPTQFGKPGGNTVQAGWRQVRLSLFQRVRLSGPGVVLRWTETGHEKRNCRWTVFGDHNSAGGNTSSPFCLTEKKMGHGRRREQWAGLAPTGREVPSRRKLGNWKKKPLCLT